MLVLVLTRLTLAESRRAASGRRGELRPFLDSRGNVECRSNCARLEPLGVTSIMEPAMSDNLHIKEPADGNKVNIHEPYEINYWCKKWGVTRDQLVAAVKAVGISKTAVAKYLGK